MVNRKQLKDMEDMANFEEDVANSSEASIDGDLNFKNYVSDEIPNDIYHYKKMRLVPNSEAEFQGLVDKDIVLANVKDVKPDPQYLRFIAETIVALDVFSKPKEVNVLDEDGKPIPITDSKGNIISFEKQTIWVRDPEFDIIRQFLRGSFKADLTLSRAMGKDREAVLDRTQNIGKSVTKEGGNSKNKYGVF